MARPKPTARNKMMDMLARRDHSELELREKLKGGYLKPGFPPEEIEKAIAFGKARGWIPSTPETIAAQAEKAAAHLHRKKKGIGYINSFLYERGLPGVSAEPDLELQKALELVKNKYRLPERATPEEKEKIKAKMGRFLISRGFEASIVRKVIYEKL